MKLKNVGSNQTILEFSNGVQVFFSYDTPVAGFIPTVGYVRTNRKYSVTTSRHIGSYLGARKALEKPEEYFLSIVRAITIEESRELG